MREFDVSAMTMPANHAFVRVLEVDRDLARALPPEAVHAARRHLVAQTVTLAPGEWDDELHLPQDAGVLGMLMLEGLITREIAVGTTGCVELLGATDVLRPWDEDADGGLVGHDVVWSALLPTRMALLDTRFTRVAGHWPELVDALLQRSLQRSRSLALHFAISHLTRVEDRLALLFWHLADRWGRVSPEGTVLPLRLTHHMLAGLVGAQRPSVTTALGQLRRAGLIERRKDGCWTIHGDPSRVDTLSRTTRTLRSAS